ncbi:MAG: glycosyltransferase family 39 protein [Candidatus Omnitrophica bacterium]|nr:glycosyltransferase family 39 protein [Candidatus Omnitrophota bacterium]
MKTMTYVVSILIFSLTLFSFGAGRLSLEFKGDENFYFESAKEMLETSDLVTPRYMGVERFQKPILFYWLVLLSFKIFGVNWFSARLVSIIFGSLLCVLIFVIADMFFGSKRMGLLAALFLATIPLYYRYARLSLPDMTLLFFLSLALFCFFKAHKQKADKLSRLFMFVSLAMAFLAKGFVGIILPILVIGLFSLIYKEKVFTFKEASLGILIFLVLVAPWFYFIFRTHGSSYAEHVWTREVLQRIGYGQGVNFVACFFKNLCFYIYNLFIKFLPYSLFMPIAVAESARLLSSNLRGGQDKRKDIHLFLIIWFLTVIIFFSLIPERRTHYLLALSVPFACYTAILFERVLADKTFFRRPGFKAPYYMALTGLVLFTILFVLSDYLTDGAVIPLWKAFLVIVPFLLLVGYDSKERLIMPVTLALALSITYISFTFSQPLGLLSNKMERAADHIRIYHEKGDKIGIGSHGIIPEELQAFFDVPVENVKAMYYDDGTPNLDTANRLIKFLEGANRVFCVIKRKDFEVFVPQDIKDRVYVIDRYYVWKRRIRFDGELLESLRAAGKTSFREIFQNEIYVVTNRKDR